MPSHTIVQTYQTAGGSFALTTTVTADTELNIDLTLAASATDILVACPMLRANIKSIALNCTADATVETNSGSAPAHTIALTANVPLIAASNAAALATPFFVAATDITALYVTCAAGGTFSLRAILDNSTNAP